MISLQPKPKTFAGLPDNVEDLTKKDINRLANDPLLMHGYVMHQIVIALQILQPWLKEQENSGETDQKDQKDHS